jgi:hypothetical protein
LAALTIERLKTNRKGSKHSKEKKQVRTYVTTAVLAGWVEI